MARRLCEAGCGFVTIHAGYAGVWDMHADGNNLNMQDGMQAVGRSFDHAVSAFIDDLDERGLSDEILLGRLRRNGANTEDQQARRAGSLEPIGPALCFMAGESKAARSSVNPLRTAASPRPIISRRST